MQEKSRLEEKREKKEGRGGFFGSLKAALAASVERRKTEKEATLVDLGVFLLGFLLGGRHIIFGAYPLGIAFIAVLPSRVWLAVVGAIAGALTLGKAGIIYSMISVIVVFLRIIVSGTDEADTDPRERLFSESLPLRSSAALIGGFIAAVYEILLSGFNLTTVCFGLSMILLPPIFTLLLSGLFGGGITPTALLTESRPIFELQGKDSSHRRKIIFFQASAALLLLLTGLSLEKYSLFGISSAYIFSAAATLFAAKRFGAVRAAAVGFFSALGVRGSLSVAFALGGAAGGILFSLGSLTAVLGAGVAVAAWGAYSGGLNGLLALLPEYCIGAAIIYLPLKKTSAQLSAPKAEEAEKCAADMIGTLALSYKNKFSGSLDALEDALHAVSISVRKYSESLSHPSEEEIYELIYECIVGYAGEDTPLPSREELKPICAALQERKAVGAEDFSPFPHLLEHSEGLAKTVNRALSILAGQKYKAYSTEGTASSLALCARLINEARYLDGREKALDEEFSATLSEALSPLGFDKNAVKVLGKKRRHFILALTDPDGTRITDKALKEEIEKATALKLGSPEYYRRGEVALMECSSVKRLSAIAATAAAPSARESVSGDTACSFSTEGGYHYSLLSDGMGSGESARQTSLFTVDFMRKFLEAGVGAESALGILNGVLRKREDECSATLDLFSLDLVGADAYFVKSGAAPSYIVRGSSIFRIRATTAPLGLMDRVDAEVIKTEVKAGDRVVMLSDGVNGSDGDPSWLPKVLSANAEAEPKNLANAVLAAARARGAGMDDMTVSVVKITEE